MAQPGMAKPTIDDQERLLDEATAVVKEQTFYMKRAIEADDVREALKHASNMICELRTSLLSPKNYYELYMQVFREMQNLSDFFGDQSRHKRKMMQLYESVQSAGNILPRLYLLATVAKSYIQSKEAAAKEILTDVNELSKGVQHPLRGLFLRYYISQMLKDKVPDTGSEFEGEGGNISDAFDFIFNNFMESNRLWVRIQHQGPAKDKARREKERHDLRALVGANLGRLSQLEGMTVDYYIGTALPRIVEHVVSVRDTMSQQYLFEVMIQVFPDEFHIKGLNQTLEAYTKAQPAVDMKPIMSTLMTRLANYASTPEGAEAFAGYGTDIFSLFRTHLQAILQRSLEAPGGGNSTTGALDISAPLEVQASFMAFTISLYPDKIHYVDIIMQSTAELVKTYCVRAGVDKLEGPAADKVVDLLSSPLKGLSLSVLEMEHYCKLLDCLAYASRKQVASAIVAAVVDSNLQLSSVDAVNSLFKVIAPLTCDLPDTPANETGLAEFVAEQCQVCRLVHQISSGDIDTDFQMLTTTRNFFGQGGQKRLVHSLPSVFFGAMALIPAIQAAERQRLETGGEGPAPTVTVKKVFQFVHKTNTALVSAAPEAALQLWLVAATVTDQVDKNSGSPGSLESICYEFLTQALICFEEEVTESNKQYGGVFKLVGTLQLLTCLDEESFDTVATKVAQHAARLLKKPMQCRAVAACSHLFWCDARRDGQKVLECMQKCLKIIDNLVQSDPKQVPLWVEVLDKYVYYYESACDKVTIDFIQSLVNLCVEHISFAEKEPQAEKEGKEARAHFRSSVKYLQSLKNSTSPDVAERYAALSLDDVAA